MIRSPKLIILEIGYGSANTIISPNIGYLVLSVIGVYKATLPISIISFRPDILVNSMPSNSMGLFQPFVPIAKKFIKNPTSTAHNDLNLKFATTPIRIRI